MEIEFRTTPTLQDYLRFQRYISVRSVWTWSYFAFSSIPLLFLVAFLMIPAKPGEVDPAQAEAGRRGGIICLSFFCVLGLVINPLLMVLRHRKRFAIDPNVHDPRTFRFSGDGFVLTRSGTTTTVQWNELSRATLHRGLLMLSRGGERAWVIPLRDVTPDMQPALLQLIRAHVPRTRGF